MSNEPYEKAWALTLLYSETFIKIIDLEDITEVQTLEGGHTRGVRGVSWDPSGTLVVREVDLQLNYAP